MEKAVKLFRTIRAAIFTAVIAVAFCACSDGAHTDPADSPRAEHGQQTPYGHITDVDSLRKLASAKMKVGEYGELMAVARRLKTIGDEKNDDEVRLPGMLYLIHGMLATNSCDSLERYFDEAHRLCVDAGNSNALISLYSDMGIYAVNVKMDYYGGISYFMKGLKLAEELGYEQKCNMLHSNLAIAYNLRNDPAGLEYALKVYDYGKSHDDREITFTGAYLTAFMYDLLKEYDKALPYIEEAVTMVDEFRDHTGVYDLYANILLGLGHEREARAYFKKAMDHAADGVAISVTNAYLNYGRYLLGRGDNMQAAALFRKGLEVSERKNNPVYRYKLHESLSGAYENMADYRRALENYKVFHSQADSVFNVERERSINQLRIQYEAERKEKEIQQNKLEILRGERRLQISVLIIVVILTALGATYILYYRKNKNYLKIVRQNQEAMNKERWYREQIEKLSGNVQQPGYADRYSFSSLTDEKGEELFRRLEHLVKTEHVYKDPELSRENIAKMLSTNRTYLSQVINAHTGLSFNYYMSSFRIDEAVRLLSDPDNDTPLKAIALNLGFSGLSTFYKLFQSTMGMPPSRYREMMREKRAGEDR